jgi:hypothetical protein
MLFYSEFEKEIIIVSSRKQKTETELMKWRK